MLSTRLTFSANASRVAVEARCSLARAVSCLIECGADAAGSRTGGAEVAASWFRSSVWVTIGASAAGPFDNDEGAAGTLTADSGGAEAGGGGGSSARVTGELSATLARGFPHSGQNSAPSRKEAPQAKHRREISGCITDE